MEITFVDHGKPWKNHGIVLLNFCGNPDLYVPVYVSVHIHPINLPGPTINICMKVRFYLSSETTCVKQPLSKRPKLVSKTNYRLMQVNGSAAAQW